MAVIKTIPTLRPRDVAATAKKLRPLVPEVMPGAQVVAGKFMRRLAARALARIADGVMPEVRMRTLALCLLSARFQSHHETQPRT